MRPDASSTFGIPVADSIFCIHQKGNSSSNQNSKIPPANTLKSPLPPRTMALLTTTCKPGQPHRVHTCKLRGEFFNPADHKWQSKTQMSARQIPAHRAYYLLTRFQLRSSRLKTHSRDQYSQEFVRQQVLHSLLPLLPWCQAGRGSAAPHQVSPQSQGKVAFMKR